MFGKGTPQHGLHTRGKHRIAGLDDTLAIPQFMRRTDLPWCSGCFLWALSRADTQIVGRCASRIAWSTPCSQLGRITWMQTSAFRNTHSHCYWP
jgi:hypothetical protein